MKSGLKPNKIAFNIPLLWDISGNNRSHNKKAPKAMSASGA
jgi:hypothetical protein